MSRTMDPVSPPETPITASPIGRRPVSNLHSQHHNIRHSLSSAQRFTSTSGRDPRFSMPPGAVGANGLPFRTTSFRPDELLPRSSGSSAMNDVVGDDATTKNHDDDDADGDDDNDVQSDSDSDSAASGSVSKSSSSAELSSPPMTSRPVPLQRRPGRASGSASPAYTPGGNRIKFSDNRQPSISAAAGQSSTRLFAVEAALIIEEIIDFDSDNGRIKVVLPYEIEEAESEREKTPDPNRNRSGKLNLSKVRRRSSARLPRSPEIDRSVMSGLRGFSLRNDSDEEALLDEDDEEGSDFDEAAYNIFRLKQRDERRRRRMTSGSISKRTISESIGSDTDNEDLSTMLDASEVGSSARRLRRRIGDRHSLQFQDPPPPRIDELEEPDTSDNEDDVKELIRDGESLARELPYYTLEYISMEVDSP